MQYLRAASKYLRCGNFQNSICQGGMSEWRSECSIQGGSEPLEYCGAPPRSGLLAKLKYRVLSAYRLEIKILRENEDQLRSQSMLSKLQSGECNDFWKAFNALSLKKESLPLTVGGFSGESNIANLYEDHFSAIANSVGSTDNRDQVTIALKTVQAIMMWLIYMSWGKLWKDW